MSCALTLALVELLLRLASGLTAGVFTEEPRRRPASFGIAHPYIGHLHTPNSHIVIEGKDFRAVRGTDGHGLPELLALARASRVVVVGDSLTFGEGQMPE